MANATIVRHPDHQTAPHFSIEYGSRTITRLDDTGDLKLLRTENRMTTYTFQMPRFVGDLDMSKLAKMELVLTDKRGYGHRYAIYPIDFRYVNSEDSEWFTGSYDDEIDSSFDIVCFAWTFVTDDVRDTNGEHPIYSTFTGPLQFYMEFYKTLGLSVTTDRYMEDIQLLSSSNLMDNPHAKVNVICPEHNDYEKYKSAPHFYIDPVTEKVLCINRDGITFTAKSDTIVTFQIPRKWSNKYKTPEEFDLYILSTLHIKSAIGNNTYDTVINSSANQNNIVYVNSNDMTDYVINPEAAPDVAIYDTIWFAWDMSSCAPVAGYLKFKVEGYANGTSKFITDEYTDIEHRSVVDINEGKVYHPDYPTAPHFSIDPTSRILRFMSDDVITLNSNDSGGSRITFQVPRMLDDTKDLYDSTAIHIFFANTSATDSQDKQTGSHTCKQLSSANSVNSYGMDDIVYVNSSTGEVFRVRYNTDTGKYSVPPSEFDTMCFSWVVAEEATTKPGYLAFAVRFARTLPEKYVWNSGMYTEISVGESLTLGKPYEETISDVLSVFYEQFEVALINNEEYVVSLIEKANEEIGTIVSDYKEQLDEFQKDFNPEVIQSFAVSDEEPTDPRVAVWINPDDFSQETYCFLEPSDIVQGEGESTTRVPSQKFVTDKFKALSSKMASLENDYVTPTKDGVYSYLQEHPELTTTVGDKSIGESKITDDLKLKTFHAYVTPRMYGASCDGVSDDSEFLQMACDTGRPVVIDETIAIGSTIYVSNSVTILEGVTVKITADVDGFKMGKLPDRVVMVDGEERVITYPIQNQFITGAGEIAPQLQEYSKAAIVIDGGRYAKVSDVSINMPKFYNRSGTGIRIESESDNSAYCRVVNTNILGFKYGIHLYRPNGSETYWNNNHEISTQTSFCANSVRLERSSHNRIKVYGESGGHPLYDAHRTITDPTGNPWLTPSELTDDSIYVENPEGTELYVVNSDLNMFDINLVDTGNECQNQYSIHFVGGDDNMVTGSVYYHRIKGSCKTISIADNTAIHPVPGMYDLFANIQYLAPYKSYYDESTGEYSITEDEYNTRLLTRYTVDSINDANLVYYQKIFTYPRNIKPSTNTLRYSVGNKAGQYSSDQQGCVLRIPAARVSLLAMSIQDSAYPKKIELQAICRNTDGVVYETDYVEVNLNAENLVVMRDYFGDTDIVNMIGLRIKLTGATTKNGMGTKSDVIVHSISAIARERFDHEHKEYAGIYRNGDIMAGDLRFVPDSGPVIISPNGTKFRLTISNDGALSATNIGTYAPEGGDYR